MNKWMSILVVLILVFSMTAHAAVPSKTTTNASTVIATESVSGVEVSEEFEVVVTEDKETVAKEIEKIYTFVTENKAPVVDYFPPAVSQKIVEKVAEKVAEKLAEMVAETVIESAVENAVENAAGAVTESVSTSLPEKITAADLEINEFVTLEEKAYTKSYGAVKTSFSFTTVYKPTQTLIALVGVYTGEVDENGEFIVEWIVLDAVANEDGSVEVIFPEDVMLQIQNAESTALAIVSTKDPVAAVAADEAGSADGTAAEEMEADAAAETEAE